MNIYKQQERKYQIISKQNLEKLLLKLITFKDKEENC
jgi:hypothetical protein